MWTVGRTGTCTFWDNRKGWGWLVDDETGLRYFVGYQDILAPYGMFRKLESGQRVEFCADPPVTGNKKATEVRVIE